MRLGKRARAAVRNVLAVLKAVGVLPLYAVLQRSFEGVMKLPDLTPQRANTASLLSAVKCMSCAATLREIRRFECSRMTFRKGVL